MATVEKELADLIATNNGHYMDDPVVARIVKYNNAWGGVAYGLEYQHEVGKYAESEYVGDPQVYWQRSDGPLERL